MTTDDIRAYLIIDFTGIFILSYFNWINWLSVCFWTVYTPCSVHPGLILKSVVCGRFMKWDSCLSVFSFFLVPCKFLLHFHLMSLLTEHCVNTLFTLHYKQTNSIIICIYMNNLCIFSFYLVLDRFNSFQVEICDVWVGELFIL